MEVGSGVGIVDCDADDAGDDVAIGVSVGCISLLFSQLTIVSTATIIRQSLAKFVFNAGSSLVFTYIDTDDISAL
ncbi:hypothetical protein ASG89_33765 [Paenibacillus sp. Soil766]|nr:hypothetical protein ASG89_33765 [Paenibacillus sp. Soil766]